LQTIVIKPIATRPDKCGVNRNALDIHGRNTPVTFEYVGQTQKLLSGADRRPRQWLSREACLPKTYSRQNSALRRYEPISISAWSSFTKMGGGWVDDAAALIAATPSNSRVVQ
jgi:hypothetical protein